MKFDPFGGAYRQIDARSERLAIDIVRAVREAVGPDVDLCIEVHDRLTVSHAICIGRQLEEFRVMWLETTVHSSDVAAAVEVARAVPVPVVVGERYQRMGMFVDLLNESSRHCATGGLVAGGVEPEAGVRCRRSG